MNESWIKLFRKFKEWGWYKNSNVKDLFLEILLTANFDDKPWQKIIVSRGQLVTSIGHLSEETGLSVRQVRTALNHLKSTNELTIKTTPQYTLITVNKYNDYQQMTSEVTNERQTNDNQVTTTKELKKERIKDNNIISEKKKKHVYKDGEVTDEMCADVASKKSVPLNEVLKTRQIMIDWCKSTGTTYADYKMTIMVWIQRQLDKGQIRKVQIIKSNIPVFEKMSPEKIAENNKKMDEIREKVVKKLVVDNKLSQS